MRPQGQLGARALLLAAALLAAICGSAAEEPAQPDLEELENEAVEKGDGESQLRAGWERHRRGDYAEALRWFELAAEAEHRAIKGAALHAIGSLYQDGHGMEQDTAEALRWWRKAAMQGDARSQTNLGMAHLQGSAGAEQSAAGAAAWFRRAAEQGDAMAQYNMAMLLLEGSGVERDPRGALRWLKHASEDAGHPGAQMELGTLLLNSKRKRPRELGLVYLRNSADRNHGPACSRLGKLYLKGGFGISPDEDAAAKWYQRAAELGDAEGQMQLAGLYASDTGVEHDDEQAARWYRAAAEQGHALAAHNLANLLFEKGVGAARRAGTAEKQRAIDREEAVHWWTRAAAAGLPDASFLLGLMYKRGQGGLKKDLSEAVKHWARAAKAGHENALRDLQGLGDQGNNEAAAVLAELFVQGAPGISPDEVLAKDWGSRAAGGGAGAPKGGQ
eukprot:TRINITY_DN24430_c0_g1_i1.p1 TRINITY_DN24430_c0_g1~~TRINITY_DN24430_c0_g1_i1.p1  ORF type:complete len:468 (+),score=170.19 TRINITY_DN24430_c0_g1_i1:68-1405(+)